MPTIFNSYILPNSFIENIVIFKCAEWRKGGGGVAGNGVFDLEAKQPRPSYLGMEFHGSSKSL